MRHFYHYPSLYSADSKSLKTGSVCGDGIQRKDRRVLYKGRWMVPIQVLVRLKVFQLAGVAALAVPMVTFLTQVIFRPYGTHTVLLLIEGCFGLD